MRRGLLTAAAAVLLPVAAVAGPPGPDLQFTGPQALTTPADVAAQARALLSRGAQPAAPAPAAPAVPPPPPQAVAAAAGAPGCGASGDITQLLSPACLDAMRALQAPGMAVPAAIPVPVPPIAVQCTVAIFATAGDPATGRSGGMSSFAVPSLERCIETGARLSFGVPGVSNITAIDPVNGIVAVSCRRPGPDGRRILCEPQPLAQGADPDEPAPAAPATEAAAAPAAPVPPPPIVQVGTPPAPATELAAGGVHRPAAAAGPVADGPPKPIPAAAAKAGDPARSGTPAKPGAEADGAGAPPHRHRPVD